MNQDSQQFQALSSEDVISVSDIRSVERIWDRPTSTVQEFRNYMVSTFGLVSPKRDDHNWGEEGIKAKVLMAKQGTGWQTGRIRLSIEFLPDASSNESGYTETELEETTGELDEFR